MSATLERDDQGLAVLTIAHGELNLFDEALLASIEQAVEQLTADVPRGVLIRADGRVVSGGVDVHLFAEIADGAAGGALWERLIKLPRALEALPCPTIFAAHALCLTAAFELALGCDLIIAARKAKFGLVERVVGLTPSMGGPQRLAERAGAARARELVYTGELYDADTLLTWGVVNCVFDDEGFDAAARKYASRIAVGPTKAHAATKELVRLAAREGVDAADAAVAAVSGPLFETEDLKGAVQSFLSDGPGKASFTGM